MPLEARLGLGLVLALAVAYSATLVAIRVAVRFEFYDKPVGYKGHVRPTPYLGGAAVIAGFLLALLAINADSGRTLPLVAGIAVLWAVGTIDDHHTIAPSVRVAVEVLLALVLWAAGLGWDLGLGSAVDLILTILWVVAVINAFNLFDNMDGAASTMALVVSAGVVAMGIVHGDTWLAVAAVALCGACLGFLPHNLASPARIFLGDGGSMPIGFTVAALVMIGAAEAVPAWQALVVGLLLVGVPALDTGLVMISRRRRGVSMLIGGRDHLTHRTQRWLRTAGAVAIALGAIQALVSALALFAMNGGATVVVLIVVLYLVAAATAIALLEASQREQAAAITGGGVAVLTPQPRSARPRISPSVPLVVALGAAAGASSFFGGFYDEGKWVPIGLALLATITAGAIARPPRLTRTAIVGLTSLAALATWELLSSIWAPSIAQATTEGNRMFVLCAILTTGLVLIRTDQFAAWLIGGVLAGIGAVAVYVLIHLFGSQPNELFIAGRLDKPLGYINGQATVFVVGFWLCFAAVERPKPWLAGAGAMGATLMACLAVLPQSRGATIAALASLVAVVALVPGSRLRRVFGLLACGAGVAAASGPLVHVYDVGLAGEVTTLASRHAALAMLVVAVAIGVIWAGIVFALTHTRLANPGFAALLRRTGVASLAIGALAVAVVAVASASRIEHGVSRQWASFTSLGQNASAEPTPRTTTRLASGSGYRYDYWRIAVDAFVEHPILGVGAGNYDRPYLRHRRTAEDVRQPHSIELQSLSELGIVGAALLACFIVALVVATIRTRARARESALSAALMVAAVGVVSTWLVQTSVDWLHLMPGISGIALLMAAFLLRSRPSGDGVVEVALVDRRTFRPTTLAAAAAAGLVLVLSATSLSRQGLADIFRDRAENALAADPAAAIREANRSLRLDRETPQTYYVKAAALARFNEADAARQALLQAASKESDNYVTWTLLGDLAVRRGRFAEAKRNYTRASMLNPKDPGLVRMALDPREALRGANP